MKTINTWVRLNMLILDISLHPWTDWLLTSTLPLWEAQYFWHLPCLSEVFYFKHLPYLSKEVNTFEIYPASLRRTKNWWNCFLLFDTYSAYKNMRLIFYTYPTSLNQFTFDTRYLPCLSVLTFDIYPSFFEKFDFWHLPQPLWKV